MTDETLTAEERERLSEHTWHNLSRKLLRLYDAALARVEAAPVLMPLQCPARAADGALMKSECTHGKLYSQLGCCTGKPDAQHARAGGGAVTDETLTAEERAVLTKKHPLPPRAHVQKLLHLYDAALARAEAAEKLSGERYMATCDWCQRASDAESSLAEATALLERGCNNVTYVRTRIDLEDWRRDARDFLSGSTPAPAAEGE